MILRQQVCYMMQVIRSAGNRRTEVSLRNIPVAQLIIVKKKGFIEQLYSDGIGKVKALLPVIIVENNLT